MDLIHTCHAVLVTLGKLERFGAADMSNAHTRVVPDSAGYRALLTATGAIPWKLDWTSRRFSYFGPQVEALLGWPPSSWVSVEDWASRMHPADREWVVDSRMTQSQSGVDHESEYRALTRDGRYVWVRDVVHVVHDADGAVHSLLGFLFDIGERKQIARQLVTLKKEIEEFSQRDGLTGVASRRRLDEALALEWDLARRHRHPLSMLMMDIDFFRQYNDRYGHVEGDACLKRVGWVLNSAATRARDILARFGGDEFVLLLPETDEVAASKLAARCRSLVLAEQIPHDASPAASVLTISVGVCTVVPGDGDDPASLVDLADRRMRQAKEQGRNCVVAS